MNEDIVSNCRDLAYRALFTSLYSSQSTPSVTSKSIQHHKRSTPSSKPTMKSLAIGTLLLAATSATVETCGRAGYDNSGHHECPSPPAYTDDRKAATPQLCSALCKSESKCQSFAVGDGSCLLYAVPTEDNFTPGRSPYFFYDVSCEITASSPPHAGSGVMRSV